MAIFDSTLLSEDEQNGRFLSKERFGELFRSNNADTLDEKRDFMKKANDLWYRVAGLNDTVDNRKKRGLSYNSLALNTVLQENNRLRDAGFDDKVLNDEQLTYVLESHKKGFSNDRAALLDLVESLKEHDVKLDDTAFNTIDAEYKKMGMSSPLKKWEASFGEKAAVGYVDFFKDIPWTVLAGMKNIGKAVWLTDEGGTADLVKEKAAEAEIGSTSGTSSKLESEDIAKGALGWFDIVSTAAPVGAIAKLGKWGIGGLSKVPTVATMVNRLEGAAEGINTLGKMINSSVKALDSTLKGRAAVGATKSVASTAKTLGITEADISVDDHLLDYTFGLAFDGLVSTFMKNKGVLDGTLESNIKKQVDDKLAAIGIEAGTSDAEKMMIKKIGSEFSDMLKRTDSMDEIVKKSNELREDLGSAISDKVIENDSLASALAPDVAKVVKSSKFNSNVAEVFNELNANYGGAGGTAADVRVINPENNMFMSVPFDKWKNDFYERYTAGNVRLVDIQNLRTLSSSLEGIYRKNGTVMTSNKAQTIANAKTWFGDIVNAAIPDGEFKKVNDAFSSYLKFNDFVEKQAGPTLKAENRVKSDKVDNSTAQETLGRVLNTPVRVAKGLAANDLSENTVRAIREVGDLKLDATTSDKLIAIIERNFADTARSVGVQNDIVDETKVDSAKDKVQSITNQ